MDRKKIYFDNASTTRIDPDVLDAMMPFLKENFGNPSSLHSFGKTAKVMLEDARDTLADFTGVNSKEIFFTGSGTESNNFALKGTAYKFINSPDNPGTAKKHIVTTSIEHSAVLDSLKFLESKFGFEVTYIKPHINGEISSDEVIAAIKENTILVTVMHSNNETGIINDIKNITEVTSDKNIFFHCDSVQSIGKTAFFPKELNVNSATFSAHKIYGPKGIAALYIKNTKDIKDVNEKSSVEKFIHGGMQERDMRGGTENIASIAGFKKAVEILRDKYDADIEHYKSLKRHLTDKLKLLYEDKIIFNSGEDKSLNNIINISFDKNKLEYDAEMVLIKLDLKGIAVSGGSACTAGTHKPSYVLTEIGRDYETALGSVRISFGRENTPEEADYFIKCLSEIVKIK